MFKKSAILFLAILGYKSFGQIDFEKGYFINNEGNKVDCLIKNLDWKNNPDRFQYKLTELDEAQIMTIIGVKEFGITNSSKYVRRTVNIDESSNNPNELTNSSNPIFKKEQVLLKVLVEGKANLYSYEDGNLRRFLFQTDVVGAEQLIYKRYLTNDSRVATNNKFKQQLQSYLQCDGLETNDYESVSYSQSSLIKLFIKYNSCQNSDFVNFEEKKSDQEPISATLRIGANSSSLESNFVNSVDYGSQIRFRLGVEGEFPLTFNKNKWAVIVEPSYQTYKEESTIGSRTITVDYESLDIPVGIRHYFYLSADSKVFVNGSFAFSFALNSKISISNSFVELNTVGYWAFGVGYKKNNKYSLELRQGLTRDLNRKLINVQSDFKAFSVIFGYRIF